MSFKLYSTASELQLILFQNVRNAGAQFERNEDGSSDCLSLVATAETLYDSLTPEAKALTDDYSNGVAVNTNQTFAAHEEDAIDLISNIRIFTGNKGTAEDISDAWLNFSRALAGYDFIERAAQERAAWENR